MTTATEKAAMRKAARRVPPELRQRTARSCDRCKARKHKCLQIPGQARCQHCEHFNYTCKTTKPRKKRLYGSADNVRARIAYLEGIVKQYVNAEGDLSSLEVLQELGASLNISVGNIQDVKLDCPEIDPYEPEQSQELQDSQESQELEESEEPEDPEESQELQDSQEPQEDARATSTEQNEELVQDQQGQDQYIGPASSYFFQMKLRSLLGRQRQHPRCQMYLFGPNPTEETLKPFASDVLTDFDVRAIAIPSQLGVDAACLPYSVPLLDHFVIEGLIRAYFDYVNVDFPVLHEASFLETFNRWRVSPSSVDRPWVCGLLCVLLLSRRIMPLGTTETQQQKWWTYVESLLPSMIFTNNIHSIQALMLAALHLHNTNHRDACWTLTGVAARIAVAIGLHRDEVVCEGPQLNRELRRSLWWTLYSFEQIQVSSHDRPSAIESTLGSTSPNERVLNINTSNWPADYAPWSTKLVSILGLVCRALPNLTSESGFSSVAELLGELTLWHTSLPQHLSLQGFDMLPDGHKRPVLLLHIQYHYTVSLLTRHSLLRHLASTIQGQTSDMNEKELETIARVCCESGRKSCELLLHLDMIGKFNAVTWWDIYYVYSSALVMTLSILSDCTRQQSKGHSNHESLSLLHNCALILNRHSGNPMVPDTMRRWIGAIYDIDMLVHERVSPTQQEPFNQQAPFNQQVPCNQQAPFNQQVPCNQQVPYNQQIHCNQQAPFNQQSHSITHSGIANTLVELGSQRDMYGSFARNEFYPNTEHNALQMNPEMGMVMNGNNVPGMPMPVWGGENEYFSWDSIGCMLLGVEALDSSFGL
ncbi:transcription factor domain-containing protein [Aspergillus tubingensis]|uniref:Zn(2)-C6 fungal-type domain-containing protein n=1 Tax=Aspergillus niger TaxID=5061 RepID=A0A100I3C0_ASPNG|nr:fungal-specific transcription factor domain-domain-containing protein [Aspergillus tubingensis]GAQ33960.1 hypothetical protein ABL_00445 [Aspergillus niger]GFN15748.1 fungal-specific transcription factor domain-domain-containing protein [Aspergillus tubingensis]GLA94849.1 hypothetical protein AtubIFM57143_001842 [Aspergillus tubingensis]GLB15307.1 hypothetical protein AtubIFM61612_005122 [Aspergillus tubingensis]